MSTKNTAMAAIAIQAPSRNFVTSTVSSTTPVMIAPKPLIDWARRIRRRAVGSVSVRSSRFQCRTMPVCDSVNDTNTPTVYSGISRVTSAWKPTTSTTANAARMRMPLENASRSPRVCSWRGR